MGNVKYKQLVIGALLGSMITGAGAVAASESNAITAFLKNEVTFKFNGAEKKLDDGYSVLSYKNSTYVPARFVAEELGANVVWDNKTNTIRIDTANVPKETVKQDEAKPADSKPVETTSAGQAADWDKYDGEWSNADVTVKLDFVSAEQANVELKSTTKADLNGLKFAIYYNDEVSGVGKFIVNGQEYSCAIFPMGTNEMVMTIIYPPNQAYNATFKGSTPLPAPAAGNQNGGGTTVPTPDPAPSMNITDYQGKWTKENQSLTITYDGDNSKLTYDNQGTTGLFDFAVTFKQPTINMTSISTEVTKDGKRFLVYAAMSNGRINLVVASASDATVFTEEFTHKE